MKKELIAFLSMSALLYSAVFLLKTGKIQLIETASSKSLDNNHTRPIKSANLVLNKQAHFLQSADVKETDQLQAWILSQRNNSHCINATKRAVPDTRLGQIDPSCHSRGLVLNDIYNNIPLH